jgi:hypothetical protein
MIIASDGQAKVEVHEPRGLFGEVIDAITKIITELGKADIARVGELVTKAVPVGTTVTTQPVPG